MTIVTPHFQVMHPINWEDELKRIEIAGRQSWQTLDKITEDSYVPFIEKLIKNKHYSVLEHGFASVNIICSRSISHALVRHRHIAVTQESTHFIDYDNGLTFCGWFSEDQVNDLENLEQRYLRVRGSAQEKRWMLPQCLKTSLVLTANFREWRHIFDVRCMATTGVDSNEMYSTMKPIQDFFHLMCPLLF